MGHLCLEHPRVRVFVDDETGAIRGFEHRGAGLSLIADGDRAALHPFMVVLADGSTLRRWQTCAVQQRQDGSIDVHWTLERGLSLRATLALDPVNGDVRCNVALRNPQHVALAALAYPYIAGIGSLAEQPRGYQLVHPYATGFLVHDPLHTLPVVENETAGEQPFLLGLYPEGFSGSTMQFMAYCAEGRGGFYAAAEDPAGAEKWLNFYRHAEGDLRLAIWHGATGSLDQRTVHPSYATVLAVLDGGSWYDAADRYRDWALAQQWMEQGALTGRDDRPRWLFEHAGLCTFGINARHDRSAWLARIGAIAGTPVLHVMGPNWPNVEANYYNSLPGGLADWFPARFDNKNLEAIRAHDDYLVPFEFDLLFGQGDGKADAEKGARALQEIPTPALSRDAYHFPFLCPACAFTRWLHSERDRRLAAEYGVDGVYYDISVNNVRHTCVASAHDHAPGDSMAIHTAYKRMLADTAAAMRVAAGGRTVPQGTEMINEQMIPYLWFYQARAEASPASPFEAGPLRELIKEGNAEKIPLFTYVYHEVGPVRLDGWAKLSKEQGDFVYFVLGRVLLQGGLIELNYEFSALEDLDGAQDHPGDHYWQFQERHYAIDPDLARYVGRLSKARVGRANRYLAYGRMLRPAPLRVDGAATLDLAYFHYNCSPEMREYESSGTMRVPAVLQAAWQFRDEGLAWLLLNLDTEARTVHLDVDCLTASAGDQPWSLGYAPLDEPETDLGLLTPGRTLTLNLPPRRPVMLEATPAPEPQDL